MNTSDDEAYQTTAQADFSHEITHVPLWVKGIIAAGILLSLTQLLEFKNSLNDAVQKSRATTAYETGNYNQAIDLYKDLLNRYPRDKGLIKPLGFAQYRAGQYFDSVGTFELLIGETISKNEAEEINEAISDMASKLNLKIKEAN